MWGERGVETDRVRHRQKERERGRERERKRELLCALCTGIVCDEEMNHCYLGIGFLQLIV